MKKQTSQQSNLEKILETRSVKQYGSLANKRGGEGVIYTRVSSEEQALKNGSLETQMKFCKDFSDRLSIPIKKFFGGTFESAKTDGRKEFMRMLSYVNKNKSVSYIIVYNYDRFSRTGPTAAQLSEDLRKKGIIVKAVMQDIDTSNPSGRFQENLIHMMNNFDNSTKSERTKIHTKEVMEKGYWPYQPPLGYKNLNPKQRACFHKYVITDEGKAIKKAFDMAAEGKLSNKEIITKLSLHGLSITQSNFRLVLTNPFYVGYVTGNLVGGRLIEGKHPALVDLKTFLKANKMLEGMINVGVPKIFRHEELPLKLFAKDELSGQVFSGYKTKGNWYYKVKTAEVPVNVRASKLNSLFVNLLANIEYKKSHRKELADLLKRKLKSKLSQSIQDATLIKKQITEKRLLLEKVEEKFIKDDISKEQFEKYKDKYNAEIDSLMKELEKSSFDGANLEKAVEKCLQIAENISSAWSSATFEKKRRLQELVFPEGILYNKQKDTVRTLRTNSLFAEMPLLVKVLEENKNGNSEKNCHNISSVPRTGIEPAHP